MFVTFGNENNKPFKYRRSLHTLANVASPFWEKYLAFYKAILNYRTAVRTMNMWLGEKKSWITQTWSFFFFRQNFSKIFWTYKLI